MAELKTFGQMFKELRLKNGFTLRGFCQMFGKDPGNISKLERGVIPPTQDRDQLESFAAIFKLQPDTEEYEQFFLLAAIDAGKIPQAILNDKEVLSRLPVLFRTMTGQKVDGSKLDALIELIKRS